MISMTLELFISSDLMRSIGAASPFPGAVAVTSGRTESESAARTARPRAESDASIQRLRLLGEAEVYPPTCPDLNQGKRATRFGASRPDRSARPARPGGPTPSP